jgi:hypothetical protein
MIRALILAALPFAAQAQDTAFIGSMGPASTIKVQPSSRPGALAEVVFDNRLSNTDEDTGAQMLVRMPGLAVMATFAWNVPGGIAGADAVTITPPEGVVCLPSDCTVTVMEQFAGTIWLFSVEGVGM